MKKNQANNQRAARAANAAVHIGQHATPQPGQVRAAAAIKRQRKARKDKVDRNRPRVMDGMTPTLQSRAFDQSKLHGAAEAWARLLSNTALPPVKCPFNFNPVPSTMSFVGSTAASKQSIITVLAGQSGQICVFPGHGILDTVSLIDVNGVAVGGSDFDEVAYHYPFQSTTGAGIVTHGPCGFRDFSGLTRPPTAFLFRSGLTAGVTETSSANMTAAQWDSPLPITGDIAQSGHLRVKLVAMSIEVINTTPELSRGGAIITVQPASVSALPGTFAALSINPSWRDHGSSSAKISWTPRLRDLAYWHPSARRVAATSVASTTNDLSSTGILVGLVSGSTDQSYDVNVVAHWEISGFSVQTLSTETKSSNLSDSVVKGAIAAHTMGQSGSQGFVDTLRAAAGGVARAVGSAVPRVGTAARIAATALAA